MDLTIWFKEVLSLSIMGSVLSIIILSIKAVFRNKLSSKMHYLIWFFLIFKLIVPLNLQSQISPFKFVDGKLQNYNLYSNLNQKYSNLLSITENSNKIQQSSTNIYNFKPLAEGYNWEINMKFFAIIWISIVVVILIYLIFTNAMMSFKISRSSLCKREDVNLVLVDVKLKLNVKKKIPIIYDKHFKSPAVYGIIRPKILISEQIISRLSLDEIRFVLFHEVSHIKRKDLFINQLIILLQAIHWFNPLIWYSLYQFKQDSEVACDATVLGRLDTKEIKEYGQTIINMMRFFSRTESLVGAMNFSNKYNKRRIKMISLYGKKKKAVKIGIATITLMLMLGCTLMVMPFKSAVLNDSQRLVLKPDQVVENYFKYYNEKSKAGVLSTLTKWHSEPNVVYDFDSLSSINLLDMYEEKGQFLRDDYIQSGRGKENNTTLDNLKVFRVKYKVEYKKDGVGYQDSGTYEWLVYVVRKDAKSPWLIDDMGE